MCSWGFHVFVCIVFFIFFKVKKMENNKLKFQGVDCFILEFYTELTIASINILSIVSTGNNILCF